MSELDENKNQKKKKSWTRSTHGVSDFQVLALTGHVWDLKGIVLVHLLQRHTVPYSSVLYKHTIQPSFTHVSELIQLSSHLSLELHDLELLRQLVELVVDVHHSHWSVRHNPGLGVHFLLV